MKKILLLLLLCLGLTACGNNPILDEPLITRPHSQDIAVSGHSTTQEAVPQAIAEPVVIAAQGNYTFLTGGVELVPGAVFDPAALPEAQSVYQVPSCAIEGTDNLYNYGSFELTAFDDGTNELIYSILLTDPNAATPEGLALGDSKNTVTEIYGENFTEEGTSRVYSGDKEQLILIFQEDRVASIEYRMIVQ